MSLYLFTEKMIKNLEKTKFSYQIYLPEEDTIVAKNSKDKLLFKDYNEENLKYFVLINYDVKVNNFFWNYNYCNEKNLSSDITTAELADLEEYSMGKLVMEIYMTEVLANCFGVIDYKKYLDKINIEKDIFKKYLINLNSKLPLTEGYLELIKKNFAQKEYIRTFVNQDEIDDIIKFLFQKGNRFSLDETKVIFENIPVTNINSASIFITKNNSIDQFEKLNYIDMMISNQESMIEQNKNSVISFKNRENFIGFNLLDMDIEEKNINIYKDVINNYIDSGGSINFDITDDKKLDEEIKQKIMFTNNLL